MRSLSWHSAGGRPGRDVAEVAQLTVEALDHRLGDPVVVGGVLDHAQLLELGEQVADLVGAELLDQLLVGAGAVESGEQAPPLRVGVLDVDVCAGAGPEQVEVAVGRLHPLRGALQSRSLHLCPPPLGTLETSQLLKLVSINT